MDDSRKIAMTSTSAYLAFTGTLIEEGPRILRNGKKLPYVGKNFAVTDGVITGCFDKNGDLDKA